MPASGAGGQNYFFASFAGSFTIGYVSNSTLESCPFTRSTLRMYSLWTTSRVRGSISMGPRGLSPLHALHGRDQGVAVGLCRRSS